MTAAKLDPEVCRRLAAECSEDDARVSGERWLADRPIPGVSRPIIAHLVGACVYPADGCWTHGVPSDVDAAAIARTRNNLPAIAAQLTAAAEMAEQCDLIALQFDAAGIDRTLPLAHQAQALQEKWHAAMLRDLQTEALAERRLVELSDRDATAWTLRQQLEGLQANLTDARRDRDALRAQLAGQPALTADEVRGLQLMRRHLDDGGHDWRDGTQMADVQAARAWLDRPLDGSALADPFTADEVRAAVKDALYSAILADGPTTTEGEADAIADRVAEKLARRSLTGLGPERAAIIDQALVYWDRDLTAPHAQIAEIRKLIGGGS